MTGSVDLDATVLLPVFSSSVVAACVNKSLATASDVTQVFGPVGGFFAWYNRTLASTSAFRHRGRARDDANINRHFVDFWSQIPTIFGVTSVTFVEFCALMSVNIEETTGDLTAAPEEVNGMNHPHPGLAYAFDAIPGLKVSYNHTPNRTALALFSDPDFLAAHGNLQGRQHAVPQSGTIDPAWGGNTWPAGVDATPDAAVNGFVMQADFYKFRGRGVIQTTWRNAYKEIVRFLLAEGLLSEPNVKQIRDLWVTSAGTRSGDALLEHALTTSTAQQWDTIFESPAVLAHGVSIDSSNNRNYLRLNHDITVLDGGATVFGSLMRMASTINGQGYASRVVPMMKMMMCGVAELIDASSGH